MLPEKFKSILRNNNNDNNNNNIFFSALPKNRLIT
jgi:hypothetical protein